MRRIIALVFAFSLFFSIPSHAEEWLQVPTYETFMDRLCLLSETDLVKNIQAEFMKDGTWKQYDMIIGKSILGAHGDFEICPDYGNGYVDMFEITISLEYYEIYSEDFHALIDGAMLAIRNDWTAEDVTSMRTELLIDTIISTPVDSMGQSTYNSIYRYGFYKQFGQYIFKIEMIVP